MVLFLFFGYYFEWGLLKFSIFAVQEEKKEFIIFDKTERKMSLFTVLIPSFVLVSLD